MNKTKQIQRTDGFQREKGEAWEERGKEIKYKLPVIK